MSAEASRESEVASSGGVAKSWPLIKRFAGQFARPHLGLAIIGLIFTAAVAAASTSYALVFGWIGDYVDRNALAQAWPIAPVIVLLTMARALTFYGQVATTQIFSMRVIEEVQRAMHAQLLRQDFARVSASPPGELTARFISDVERMRDALTRIVTNFGRDILTLLGGILVMIWTDWLLALIVLVVYPLGFQPVIRLGARLRRDSRDAQAQIGRLSAFLSESFAGARLVKTYGLEDYQTERANAAFAERRGLEVKMARHRAKVEPILEVAGGIGFAGVLGFVVWRAATTGYGFETLMTFVGALAIMAPAARSLGNLNAFVQQGLAAAQRIFELLDQEPTVASLPSAPPLAVSRGEVRLENVRFAYADGTLALNGLDLTLEAGRVTALVGPSGAGKSSVLNLIPRLYDVDGGRVLIDGQDVRDHDLASVRAAVSFVSQDAVLFDDTIRANIAFGQPDADEDAIRAAAEAAAAWEFIVEQPGGLGARVGPGGQNLSGGQRQRIALARAFLRDAPILLLDEATSALDAESEARVQAALERLSAGRTTLVIAHRLATVRSADMIYVMDQGCVVEQGRDGDLAERPEGLYAKLRALQFTAA